MQLVQRSSIFTIKHNSYQKPVKCKDNPVYFVSFLHTIRHSNRRFALAMKEQDNERKVIRDSLENVQTKVEMLMKYNLQNYTIGANKEL